MIPIFHTKFDPLQVLFLSICKIPPTGDFGDFWRFLVATFSNFIRMKLVIPIFHTEFDPLQVFAIKTEYFVTKISVKESSGLDQKYLGLKNRRKLYIKLAIQTTWFFKRYVDVKQFN